MNAKKQSRFLSLSKGTAARSSRSGEMIRGEG